jgi:hypothetical protein
VPPFVSESANLKSANDKLATFALLVEFSDQKGDDFAEQVKAMF